MNLRFAVGDKVVVASAFDEGLSPATRMYKGMKGEVEEVRPEYVPYPYSVKLESGARLAFAWDELVKQVEPVTEPNEDAVDHPSHYNWLPGGLEVIDITRHLNFVRGNAVKYLLRADHKGQRLEDLRKALWYINYEIRELEEAS
ncbi:DUF3310 domain-containing protein [Kitasatospora cineracea]|uniref:DUF3310 domain-containing protein n=1 Tax=Kitasatospora cineracea TaxID=88074 RepID=UPI0037F5DE0A